MFLPLYNFLSNSEHCWARNLYASGYVTLGWGNVHSSFAHSCLKRRTKISDICGAWKYLWRIRKLRDLILRQRILTNFMRTHVSFRLCYSEEDVSRALTKNCRFKIIYCTNLPKLQPYQLITPSNSISRLNVQAFIYGLWRSRFRPNTWLNPKRMYLNAHSEGWTVLYSQVYRRNNVFSESWHGTVSLTVNFSIFYFKRCDAIIQISKEWRSLLEVICVRIFFILVIYFLWQRNLFITVTIDKEV